MSGNSENKQYKEVGTKILAKTSFASKLTEFLEPKSAAGMSIQAKS